MSTFIAETMMRGSALDIINKNAKHRLMNIILFGKTIQNVYTFFCSVRQSTKGIWCLKYLITVAVYVLLETYFLYWDVIEVICVERCNRNCETVLSNGRTFETVEPMLSPRNRDIVMTLKRTNCAIHFINTQSPQIVSFFFIKFDLLSRVVFANVKRNS